MSETDEKPLQLNHHLRLRSELSTVQKSTVFEVIRAAPSGHKIGALIKFLKARYGTGKLSSGEFVQFGFARPEVEYSHIQAFAGKQAQQAFNKIYNDRTWYAVTKNKMLFETLMKGAEQPVPKTIAIYDRKGRGAGANVLKSNEELAEFLSDQTNHPMFCKPTTGLLSIGSFRIEGKQGENLIINDHHEYTVGEVCEYINGISKKGYLFQRVLEPHDHFGTIGCDVISSLRLVVLNHETHAELHSAVLKLPASGEVADNFWRQGSVLASISLETGKVERAISKTESGALPLDPNDKQQANILNFEVPQFEEAKKVVLAAARFMPAVKVQSWDVALTQDGPVLLEVNFGGDLNLYQLASNRGVMTPTYCKVLKESGFTGRLPKI